MPCAPVRDMSAMKPPGSGESDLKYISKTLIILFIPFFLAAETDLEAIVEFLRQLSISLLYCAAIGGTPFEWKRCVLFESGESR